MSLFTVLIAVLLCRSHSISVESNVHAHVLPHNEMGSLIHVNHVAAEPKRPRMIRREAYSGNTSSFPSSWSEPLIIAAATSEWQAIQDVVKANRMVTADLLPYAENFAAISMHMQSEETREDENCCGSTLRHHYSGYHLSKAVIDFDKLKTASQPDMWSHQTGQYPLGSVEVLYPDGKGTCSDSGRCYQQADKWTGPLLSSISYVADGHAQHQGSGGTAVLVIRDYNNIFHQMGSVVASFDALRHFSVSVADQIVFCDDHSDSSTGPLWSPVLGNKANYKTELSGRVAFSNVIIPRSSCAHWWWNVWRPDHTQRVTFFQALKSQVLERLQVNTNQRSLITFIERTRGYRKTLNQAALLGKLRKEFPSYTVESKDFGALPWASQMQQVRASKVLMSNHGAGLTWDIYLPKDSIVFELLGASQGNQYFHNHARWTGITYLKWQNHRSSNEQAGSIPKSFNNNINVNCDEVLSILKSHLAPTK